MNFDFLFWCYTHIGWSLSTFGPPEERGPLGPIDHLKKEVAEFEKEAIKDYTSDDFLEEATDLIHLVVDAVWRAGHTPMGFFKMLIFKQKKNIGREWPDWRSAPKDTAIEHVRTAG